MNHELSSNIQEQARILARQISASNDLDPEIQEELYGHIEDKLLAYLNGEETLTEDDALILVREHLGDAKAVRGLLEEVHGDTVPPQLGRRILAVITAAFGVQVAFQLFRNIAVPALGLLGSLDGIMDPLFVTIAVSVLSLAALYSVLSRWRGVEASGKSVWYTRWPISRVWFVCVGAVVLSWAMPAVSVLTDPNGWASPLSNPRLMGVLSFVLMFGSCALWLWWTGASRRALPLNFGLGLAWMAFTFFRTLYPAKVFILFGDSHIEIGASSFAQGHVGDTSVTAYLTYVGPWQSFSHINPALTTYAAVAFLSCLAAAAWNQRWHKSRPMHTPNVQP